MPALSPTMTEGNIAAWNVKEGDSFSAGDVLLEIETDKATMDVEAQEDGIMFKIMKQGGEKGVQVGTRIAVMAETGDDLASLEVPKDESTASAAPKQEKKEEKKVQGEDRVEQSERTASGNIQIHPLRLPLYPSVGHIVKEKGLSDEDLSKITPTGPGGRLLKGDVLAYIGSINSSTPSTVSSRFDKLAHLDLSNIKIAEKKEKPAAPAAQEPEPVIEEDLEISISVSLSKVVEVQNKIQDTLGVFLPISTFISRAADVANSDLPAYNRQPTTDELFDQVLGLDKVKGAKGSRGIYLPQISAIPPHSAFPPAPAPKQADIIDILSAKPQKTASAPSITTVPGLSSSENMFSLIVPQAEEKRAQVFLEKCKVILEQEPGRLVL